MMMSDDGDDDDGACADLHEPLRCATLRMWVPLYGSALYC